MRDILLKHKAEVARLIFREFDEAEYMRLVEKDTERQIGNGGIIYGIRDFGEEKDKME